MHWPGASVARSDAGQRPGPYQPGATPQVWSLDIYEPQRGSVPRPNVVPRLRDYVGLACQHDGNPNGVAPTFAQVSIIIGHFRPPDVERAMGRNPIGVDVLFVPSTQR